MKSIKLLLSLFLFLVSSFSYGEEGVYMLVSGDLTEEQVSDFQSAGYKALGRFRGFEPGINIEYHREEDSEGINFLSLSFGHVDRIITQEERIKMIRSIYDVVTSKKANTSWGSMGYWDIGEKHIGFSDISKYKRIAEIMRKKGSWQAVMEDEEEIYSEMVTMELIPQSFYSHTGGGLGSIAKYNFNENFEIGVSFGRGRTDTVSNDYGLDEEELKALQQKVYDMTYRAAGIGEEPSIAFGLGTYETEIDLSKGKIHFHLSEPIGGGGGGTGSPFSSLSEISKSLIPSHSTLERESDYLQPRTKALEWNNNNDSSVLFVLPSQSFSGSGNLDSW